LGIAELKQGGREKINGDGTVRIFSYFAPVGHARSEQQDIVSRATRFLAFYHEDPLSFERNVEFAVRVARRTWCFRGSFLLEQFDENRRGIAQSRAQLISFHEPSELLRMRLSCFDHDFT
jgi:hypothetical protein